MTRDRASEILAAAATRRILVVGDLILDEFLWGSVERISPEAPVPVVHLSGESWYPGGAANVARNLREFTPKVGICGVTGDDDHGRRLISLLEEKGIRTSCIAVDTSRPTVVKTRIIARNQQVVRVDRERPGAPSPDAAAKLQHALLNELASVDAVIVADYAKGVVQDSMARALADWGGLVTIDPSPANPISWRAATAIKPNRGEAIRIAGQGPIEQIAGKLLERWDTKMILITLGEDGMLLVERGGEPFRVAARAREVFDVSGAGDTAIALFTLALSAGATPRESAELANAASGVVVGKLGTAVLTPEELIGAIA